MTWKSQLLLASVVFLWVTNPSPLPTDAPRWMSQTRIDPLQPAPASATKILDLGLFAIARGPSRKIQSVTGLVGPSIPQRWVGICGKWFESRWGPELNPLSAIENAEKQASRYWKQALKRYSIASVHDKIALANIAVFLLLRTRAANTLAPHVLLLPDSFKRPWSLLMCGFNQPDILALVLFISMERELGPSVEYQLGTRSFMKLYVGVGVAGSIVLLLCNHLLRWHNALPYSGGFCHLVGITAAIAVVGGDLSHASIMGFGPIPIEFVCWVQIGLYCAMNGVAHLPGLIGAASSGIFLGEYFYLQTLFSTKLMRSAENMFDATQGFLSDVLDKFVNV